MRADLAHALVLYEAGNYKGSEPLVRDAVARADALAYPPLVATARYDLGRLENILDHVEAAQAALREARFAAEAAGNDRLKAEIAISIANLVASPVESDEAARMQREAEATIARLGSPPELVWLLHDGKAKRLYAAGDFAAARDEYQRALAIVERLDPESLDLTNLLNNIGACDLALGELERAIATNERVRAMRAKLLGPEHPEVARSIANLAIAYMQRGDTDRALPLYEQARELVERSLGPDHPRVANTCTTSGCFYYQRNELGKAGLYASAPSTVREGVGPRDQTGGLRRAARGVPGALGDSTSRAPQRRARGWAKSRRHPKGRAARPGNTGGPRARPG